MSEFHDPDLRQELGRLSGPYPDDNAAFAAWQRRVGQVRRRRIVAWTATAALALVVGTVAVAAVQSPRRHTVVPGKSADSSVDVTLKITSTAAEASSTVPQEADPETSPPAASATEAAPSVADTSVPETGAPEAAVAPSNGPSSEWAQPRTVGARAADDATADADVQLGRRQHHRATGRRSPQGDRRESGARLQGQAHRPFR